MKKTLIIFLCSFSLSAFSQTKQYVCIDKEGIGEYCNVKALIPSGNKNPLFPLMTMGTIWDYLEFYKVDADGYWVKFDDTVFHTKQTTEHGKLLVWLTKGFRYAYCYSHWEDQTPIEIIPVTTRFKAN